MLNLNKAFFVSKQSDDGLYSPLFPSITQTLLLKTFGVTSITSKSGHQVRTNVDYGMA